MEPSKGRVRRLVRYGALAGLLSAVSCSRGLPAMDGVREAPKSYDRYGGRFLVLQQNGNEVIGTACELSSGFTCFHVQAAGVHPFVTFVVREQDATRWCPNLREFRWQGEMTSADEIVSMHEPRIVYRRSAVDPEIACRFIAPPTGHVGR